MLRGNDGFRTSLVPPGDAVLMAYSGYTHENLAENLAQSVFSCLFAYCNLSSGVGFCFVSYAPSLFPEGEGQTYSIACKDYL